MAFYNTKDFEIVSRPENEMPRQFLLREVGFDYTALDGLSWHDIKEAGLMDTLADILAHSSRPSVVLRSKS